MEMKELIEWGMENKMSSFITRYRETLLKLINKEINESYQQGYDEGFFDGTRKENPDKKTA